MASELKKRNPSTAVPRPESHRDGNLKLPVLEPEPQAGTRLCSSAAGMSARKSKAGCIPIKITKKGNLKVLLLSSSKSGDNWVLPKGTVEDGETAEEAAMRETVEEAGVEGYLAGQVASVYFAKKDADVLFYAMVVTRQLKKKAWDERKSRTRKWLSLPKATAAVAGGAAKGYVVEALRQFGLWLDANASALPTDPTIVDDDDAAAASSTPAAAAE